jgi:hypothetical protein
MSTALSLLASLFDATRTPSLYKESPKYCSGRRIIVCIDASQLHNVWQDTAQIQGCPISVSAGYVFGSGPATDDDYSPLV